MLLFCYWKAKQKCQLCKFPACVFISLQTQRVALPLKRRTSTVPNLCRNSHRRHKRLSPTALRRPVRQVFLWCLISHAAPSHLPPLSTSPLRKRTNPLRSPWLVTAARAQSRTSAGRQPWCCSSPLPRPLRKLPSANHSLRAPPISRSTPQRRSRPSPTARGRPGWSSQTEP